MSETIQKIPFVDLPAQYQTIGNDVDAAIAGVVKSCAFILGPDVKLFEEEFADYCGTAYAVGVDSGTSAIELMLRAYEVGQGDEVIIPANTYIATALAVSYTGAVPVFVEPDPLTYNIHASNIEKAITVKTRAIIPVHLCGQAVDMDPIKELAARRSLLVLEDACQAHGARYKGKRVGGLGDAAAFSFYPGKNLGAYGDGGMITTNDKKIIDTVRMLRDYGQTEKYHHVKVGYNHRLDTIQAAILRVKLKHLDQWNEARRKNAVLYQKLMADFDIQLPVVAENCEAIWHLFMIQADHREELKNKLGQKGVSTGIHYPIPIHLQGAYANLGHKKGDFPVTEKLADKILSLPMYAELPEEMLKYVVEVIKESL